MMFEVSGFKHKNTSKLM